MAAQTDAEFIPTGTRYFTKKQAPKGTAEQIQPLLTHGEMILSVRKGRRGFAWEATVRLDLSRSEGEQLRPIEVATVTAEETQAARAELAAAGYKVDGGPGLDIDSALDQWIRAENAKRAWTAIAIAIG